MEFADYRPYQPGDDLRYLDWKIAARADRWVIRQFEEETNLRASVVLDVSRSMAWSGAALAPRDSAAVARLTKLAYAEQVAAAVALLLLRQRDAVGLIRFDDRIRTSIPPRARRGQWQRLMGGLAQPGSGKASSAGEALGQAGRVIRRRGMIILISDLLMDVAQVETAVRGLRAAGHDVTVLHIMDPAERELPAGGEALFVDPESSDELPTRVPEVRAAYRETVEQVIAEWRRVFGGLGAGYEVVGTDSPFGVPLHRAFVARQGLP